LVFPPFKADARDHRERDEAQKQAKWVWHKNLR
jgi:hypothetical protein